MSKYKVLDDLIDVVYSVDLGLSEEQGEKLLLRMLRNGEWRVKVSSEVERALSDKEFSWAQFLDEHDICSADSEIDARTYAEKIILRPLTLSEKG